MKKLVRDILIISAISLLLAVLIGIPACGKDKKGKPISDFYFFAAKNDITMGEGNQRADATATFNISSLSKEIHF